MVKVPNRSTRESVALVPRLSTVSARRTISSPPNQATANAAQMTNLGSAGRKPLPRITAADTRHGDDVPPGDRQELGSIGVLAANRVPEPRHEQEECAVHDAKGRAVAVRRARR